MTEYLRLEDLLAIEQELGSPGIRDVGLLDSACARPQANVFGEEAYPSLALKIAALVHSVVTNHALVDGTKRMSAYVLFVFPGMNDHELVATDDEAFDFIMAIADGTLRDVGRIAAWIEPRLTPAR